MPKMAVLDPLNVHIYLTDRRNLENEPTFLIYSSSSINWSKQIFHIRNFKIRFVKWGPLIAKIPFWSVKYPCARKFIVANNVFLTPHASL